MVDALRKNPKVFVPELSLVATIDNQIRGHILFSKIKIHNERGQVNEIFALAPMAARPEFQKLGIGGQLIESGLEKATQLGFKSLIVLGHEHYYPKFGFEPAEKWNIKASFEVPSPAYMAIELVSDGLRGISGIVHYPVEFGEV